jgi:hypothetical protein
LKNKDFFRILKTDDDSNYLGKFVEQLFSKIYLDALERAKNTFSESPKLKILIKKVLLYLKRTKKTVFVSVDQNSR